MQRSTSARTLTNFIVAASICSLTVGCNMGGGGGGGGTTSGNCSGNGTGDTLNLTNNTMSEITVTIGYPDNTTCIQVLSGSPGAFSVSTMTDTSFVEDEIYTFNASSPGILDAMPVECRVTADPVASGVANVAFNTTVNAGEIQVRTVCAGGGLEDLAG